MTVRHSILAAGAVLVLGMAIYLVREVSRTPPDAKADRSPSTTPPARDAVRSAEPPPTAAKSPTATRVATADTPPDRTPPDRTQPIEEVQPPESVPRLMPTGPNPKLDAIMAEANRAYDHGEFEDAKQLAVKILEKSPNNVRMLRIIVSSECIAGDAAEAQKYFAQLPAADRAQMRTRCDRYGVTFKDP